MFVPLRKRMSQVDENDLGKRLAVVLVRRTDVERARERELAHGCMCSLSLFPQYFTRAIFGAVSQVQI